MRKWVTGWRPLFALACLALIGWAALRGMPDVLTPGRLRVWFLDVGQGDAILIQTPGGRQILVDGGPNPSALYAQLGEVLPFWDRSLDVVVLTHPDADHANGLIPIFDRYAVGTALDAVTPDPAAGTGAAAGAWVDALAASATPRQNAARGMRVTAGAAELTVLNPAADGSETTNNGSVVMRLDYGATSLLLTGDAEWGAEQAMLEAGVPLRAQVLKIGHHGSSAGTSPEFLAAVQPQLAVISVGADNRFGHPAPELLERLAGIDALRTDQRGRIELISDGQVWTVRCKR